MGPITNLDERLASDRATVTVRETALVLGVDQRTITRAIAAGELPALRIGRRVLIPRLRLVALLIDTDTAEAA
ncbi:MAG TPA: helix-turn-helix domain-containing protein [Actinotalea caeni]|uniref:helix-turn-helix domain-containing protein n=1 Tax=Actinotalea caeni TaxID=1348467 RepID=UPI002B4AB6D9|nr:helix-turn-helix domain-containing protein [Actinotalea caeni]HLV55771.1 helix-turn-helix domain-containing protein [Actinotalea caeni]